MKREHGLRVNMTVWSAPHEEPKEQSDWFRPLPGLARPVAKGVEYTIFGLGEGGTPELPQKGPNLPTLRAREVGLHKILGGARQKWNSCRLLPSF